MTRDQGGAGRELRMYVAAWRRHRHLKQREIAEKLGVVVTTISRWEHGRPISKANQDELAKILDIAPADLWRDPNVPDSREMLNAFLARFDQFAFDIECLRQSGTTATAHGTPVPATKK